MKIVIDSLDELKELAYIISHGVYACNEAQRTHEQVINNLSVHVTPDTLPADIAKPIDPMAGAQYGHDLHPEGYAPKVTKWAEGVKASEAAMAESQRENPIREHEIESTHRQLKEGLVNDQFAAAQLAVLTGVELDSTGRRWDEEIDSAAKKQTKAGAWVRSKRRDLTDERYNARAAELIAEAQAAWAPDKVFEEPVATERHALPVDAQEMELNGNDEMVPVQSDAKPTVDLAALVEASADASLELSGGMQDLMNATRAFIETHGVQAMNELRAFVAPDPNNPEVGLSVGSLKADQRALIQACIVNYSNFVS